MNMRIKIRTTDPCVHLVICSIRQLEYDSIRQSLWLYDTLDGCYVLECDDAYAQFVFTELEREGFISTHDKLWRVCA